jgi:hypothetical protein
MAEENKEKISKDFRRRLTSRKLLITVVLHLLSNTFLIFGTFDAVNWIDFNKYLVGFYFGANALTHFSNAFKKRS